MTARVVSSNVHGAVTFTKVAGGGLLQSMQDSVEKLTGLAPYIFPLAQGEIYSCGIFTVNLVFIFVGLTHVE